jgi:hypothetical protein
MIITMQGGIAMETYTVSFFGHREISQPFLVEERLKKLVKELINQKEYVEFLVGRDGEFDLLAASVIHKVKKECDCGNSSLVLVLPYMRAEYRDNEQNFLDYYDEVEVCAESASAHFKAAIKIRNQSMVIRSDLVICCVERKSGGAYTAVRYAEKNGVEVVNLIKDEEDFFDIAAILPH